MSKLSFKEWSILSDLQIIDSIQEDYEFSMARSELKTTQAAISRLMQHLKGEGELEAWIQSKITKAADYIDTVADYIDSGESETKDEVKEAVLGRHEDRGKKLRSKEERLGKKKETPVAPTGPKITKLKPRGPRKGEATASQVQGWRGTDRTNTNRKGQTAPQAKAVTKEEWSEKYKKSIDCDHPKGFSQRAHCQGKKKKVKENVEFTEALKSHYSVDQIAKKHRLDASFIQNQLDMGIKIEHEHVTDKDTATDIALQHLDEIPDYYTRLKKMEASAKKEHKKFKDVKEDTEILDANGTLFATVIDLIKGTDEKFKGFSNVEEERKSGDYSLHDWFSKSKSSDGKPGWVQLGGKYAGKPCAKQPGQDTKPKCGSSKMSAEMSPEEENSAARRKRREDPNPDRKGKAKMVDTNESAGEKDACYKKVKSRFKVWPSAYASGALVQCRKKGAANWGTKSENTDYSDTDDLDNPMGKHNIKTHEKKIHFHDEVHRYCPMCQKDEKASECKYGTKYWKMFSVPVDLAPKKFTIATTHPGNMPESLSFEVRKSSGAGALTPAAAAQLGPKAIELQKKKAAGVDLPLKSTPGSMAKLADSVIHPGQLTTEDYQRLQSTGAVYTILFSWRGRPMMNLQLFFPTQKRPSKDEVKLQVEKLYPGAVIMQWYPSPSDPTKPIVVVQK
jgi:hypothetical protein